MWGMYQSHADRAGLTRLRVLDGRLRPLAFVLTGFAAVTAWAVYRGAVPSGIVVVMLAFIAIAPIAALPYLLCYRWALAKSKAAEAWPRTIGQVETSFMEDKVSDWAAPIVVYTYLVEGRRYRGTRVQFGGTGAIDPVAAEQILSFCEIGAQVPVYYNPAKPGQSVLLPARFGPNQGLLRGAELSAGAALLGAAAMALLILLGLVDAALTAVVGYRVLP